jgi:hypothetical protein
VIGGQKKSSQDATSVRSYAEDSAHYSLLRRDAVKIERSARQLRNALAKWIQALPPSASRAMSLPSSSAAFADPAFRSRFGGVGGYGGPREKLIYLRRGTRELVSRVPAFKGCT